MRTLMLVPALMLTLTLEAWTADTQWLSDFNQAKALAAEKKLPILADFAGSDWCGWCMKLDREVFSKQEFIDYAKDKFVLFLADYPMGKEQADELVLQNTKLQKEYEIEGLPTILLLDADGKVIARTGYVPGGALNYIEHLRNLQAGKD